MRTQDPWAVRRPQRGRPARLRLLCATVCLVAACAGLAKAEDPNDLMLDKFRPAELRQDLDLNVPVPSARPVQRIVDRRLVEAVAPALPDANQTISVAQAAVLGVVEGLTEYLPVSSTGHLILAGHAMGLTRFTEERGPFGRKLQKAGAINAFEIVIQLGAILAVLGLYRRRVGQMGLGLAGRNPQGLRLIGLLLAAFLPAAVIGKLFHRKIEEHLFGPVPVILAMAAGGAAMILVEYFFWTRRDRSTPRTVQVDAIRWGQALIIGLAQCLAMWPGTSRSMVTILAGLVVGLDMVTAAEFSFLLALPTLGAATVYSGYGQWHDLMSSAGPAGLAVGLAVSGIVAALAVKAFVKWLTCHGMMPFGVYRLVAAAALYAYFLTR